MKHPGEVLGERLLEKDGVFAPGVSSPQSARALFKTGNQFLYISGYAESALYGYPDMGFRTATEMLRHATSICEAVEGGIFILDVDDGYGDAKNVRRTVRNILKQTEVAAIHLEDQRYPKRCGHLAGKSIVSRQEFKGKLKAAREVIDEISSPVKLIARTDAFGAAGGNIDGEIGGDIKEASERGREYAEIADLVWCEFPNPDRKSAKAFAEGMRGYMPRYGLAFNYSLSFKWIEWILSGRAVTTEDLIDWNYRFRFATYPSTVAEVYIVSVIGALFKSQDPIEVIKLIQEIVRNTPAESIIQFAEADFWQKFEKKFIPGAEERISGSQGFGGKE